MEDMKIKFVQDTNHKITAEQMCKCLTGLSITSLAQAIASNVGGQYDSIYKT